MMTENSAFLLIFLMSAVVLATRMGGYVLGLGFGQSRRIKGILEVLPGCAMMALIVPGAMGGTIYEVVALVITALVI